MKIILLLQSFFAFHAFAEEAPLQQVASEYVWQCQCFENADSVKLIGSVTEMDGSHLIDVEKQTANECKNAFHLKETPIASCVVKGPVTGQIFLDFKALCE